jgi:eukaryotic-like serine/threonine-protein kinase
MPDLDDTADQVLDDAYCPVCNAVFASFIERCPDDGARLKRSRDPLLGTTLDGRFRVVGPIGEGSMGRVYLGIQLSVNRAVAIKTIRDRWATDRDAARRFEREVRMLTRLSHPNIVNVYDFGSADGVLYLVMELLRGRTLADELSRRARFDVRRACEIAIQLCDALAAAHTAGVVHRDLKPANIVLVDASSGRDLVKVLDFGLAKPLTTERISLNEVTRTGIVLGTPLYLAPEAIAGDPASPSSDLYALGCVLFEMLAGAPPFVETSIELVMRRQLTADPPPLPANVPSELASVVASLLAKEPEARPPSALAVAARLHALIAAPIDDLDEATTFPRASPVAEPPPPRELPVAAMMAVACVLAVIACVLVVLV